MVSVNITVVKQLVGFYLKSSYLSSIVFVSVVLFVSKWHTVPSVYSTVACTLLPRTVYHNLLYPGYSICTGFFARRSNTRCTRSEEHSQEVTCSNKKAVAEQYNGSFPVAKQAKSMVAWWHSALLLMLATYARWATDVTQLPQHSKHVTLNFKPYYSPTLLYQDDVIVSQSQDVLELLIVREDFGQQLDCTTVKE